MRDQILKSKFAKFVLEHPTSTLAQNYEETRKIVNFLYPLAWRHGRLSHHTIDLLENNVTCEEHIFLKDVINTQIEVMEDADKMEELLDQRESLLRQRQEIDKQISDLDARLFRIKYLID